MWSFLRRTRRLWHPGYALAVVQPWTNQGVSFATLAMVGGAIKRYLPPRWNPEHRMAVSVSWRTPCLQRLCTHKQRSGTCTCVKITTHPSPRIGA